MLSFKGWGGITVTVKKPVTIRRISDLRDNHMTLGLFCLDCNRWGEIVPNEWLSSGKKDLDYVNQKFKCRECGSPASKQVRPQPIDFSRGANHILNLDVTSHSA